MSIIKKKYLNELVGGDINSNGGDFKHTTSHIETGPYEKDVDDKSTYEKGVSIWTDIVTALYRQDLPPWSMGNAFPYVRGNNPSVRLESNSRIIKKQTMEEEVLNKEKNFPSDINAKDYNPKIKKLKTAIEDLSADEIKILSDLLKKTIAPENKLKNIS